MKNNFLFYTLAALTLFSCGEDDETVVDIQTKLTSTEWEFVSEYSKVEVDGNINETVVKVGQLVLDEQTINVTCENGSTTEFDIAESYKINYQRFKFTPDFTLTTESSTEKKNMNYNNTTCESGVVYDEETVVLNMEGTWSFDESNNQLTLNQNYDGFNFSQVSKLAQSGNNIILSIEVSEPDNNYKAIVETTLKPRS